MNSRRGFTLIELIVVIAIMATLMGMVGPLVVTQVDKAQSRVEEMRVKKLIKHYKNISFLSSAESSLSFEGKLLEVTHGNQLKAYSFDKIFFQPTSININRNGEFPDTNLSYKVGQEVVTLTI